MPRAEGLHRLIGFGLAIASDRAIAGTRNDNAETPRTPNITVETRAPLLTDEPPSPVYRWDGETLVFSAPGVALYRCQRGSITITAERTADPGTVSDLLVSTALPAVLWLRGESVLHAAAIVSPAGLALAIAGPSGVGKSTVVSHLLGAGGTLLADDTIRLSSRGDVVCGSGLSAGYHLAPRDGFERVFHTVSARQPIDRAPIRAIVFLSRTSDAPSIERLDAVGGLARLLANQHRPAIPAMIGRVAQTLALFSRVAQHCEMYHWHRSSPILDIDERAMLTRAGLAEWMNA